MTKLKHLLTAILFLTQFCVKAQSYYVHYTGADVDSTTLVEKAKLKKSFASQLEASLYITRLASLLQNQGYITASVDTIRYDSADARIHIFLGEQYKWANINTPPENAALLESLHWNEKIFDRAIDFAVLQSWQKRVLDDLEAN